MSNKKLKANTALGIIVSTILLFQTTMIPVFAKDDSSRVSIEKSDLLKEKFKDITENIKNKNGDSEDVESQLVTDAESIEVVNILDEI